VSTEILRSYLSVCGHLVDVSSHVAASGVMGCQKSGARLAVHFGQDDRCCHCCHCCDSGDGHVKARIDAAPHPLCRCSSPHLVRHQISFQGGIRRVVASSKSRATRPAPRIATRLTGSLFWVKTVSDAPRGLSSTPPQGLARLASRCLRNIIDNPPSTFDLRTHPGQPRATLEMLPRP
jgi:hypothetical protein